MSDPNGGGHLLRNLADLPSSRGLPDPRPCPPWCSYTECHVESLVAGNGEVVFAEFGLTAEQCHSSQEFTVQPASLPELEGWWPWPRPRAVHVNVVTMQGWLLDHLVESVGPAVVVDCGEDGSLSLDPVAARRLGAALIRFSRMATQREVGREGRQPRV